MIYCSRTYIDKESFFIFLIQLVRLIKILQIENKFVKSCDKGARDKCFLDLILEISVDVLESKFQITPRLQ
jgi:hypothetical protein